MVIEWIKKEGKTVQIDFYSLVKGRLQAARSNEKGGEGTLNLQF